ACSGSQCSSQALPTNSTSLQQSARSLSGSHSPDRSQPTQHNCSLRFAISSRQSSLYSSVSPPIRPTSGRYSCQLSASQLPRLLPKRPADTSPRHERESEGLAVGAPASL